MTHVAFDLDLRHGRCVVIRLPETGALEQAAKACLLPEEMSYASGFREARRRSWLGGRVAMREALARSGLEAAAVLPDARGAPKLPDGISGSITHKVDVAAALVIRAQEVGVGVDIEEDVPSSLDISRKVLTSGEIADLAHLDDESRAREVLLRFSAKEALYKALDPFVRRFVGFTEVAIATHEDGEAEVSLLLRGGEGPFVAEASWKRFDGLVLTTARVRRSS